MERDVRVGSMSLERALGMCEARASRLVALSLHERLTGRHVLARMEELRRTTWLPRDELLRLQRDKLLRLLEYSYRYVPYYRRVFAQAGLHPDDVRNDLSVFTRLPILTKAEIRENSQDLLTTERSRRRSLRILSTSGSTGEPLRFMQDRDFRDAVTADVQRHLSWAGWDVGDRHAFIWGAPFQASLRQRGRTRMIDWTWNRFAINAFAMTEPAMEAFARRVRRERPRILMGYASSLHRFAEYVQGEPERSISFDAVFSSAEVLLPAVRQRIEATFACRVYNRYGTLELGGLACECEAQDGLHVSVESNYLEVLCDGEPAGNGAVGELVVTNLNNLGMPFIRYRNGDAAAWADAGTCECGRASPKLRALEGRIADSFVTADGRHVWAGFTGIAWRDLAVAAVRQFQIVQKSVDRFIVRLMTDAAVAPAVLDAITNDLRRAFGDAVSVEFEFVGQIPPLPSGKHRYAVCEVAKTVPG